MRESIWLTATDLEHWAGRREAQALLPMVIRRLILATTDGVRRAGFRSGEGVSLPGWDGVVEAPTGNAFVPAGASRWELGVGADITGKATDDYKKRSDDPEGVDPKETTFVFATPRRWPAKEAWVSARKGAGKWRDVVALDGDDLETWLEEAPAVQAWLARVVGTMPPGVRDLDHFWSAWCAATQPPSTAELILAGRESAIDRLHTWLSGEAAVLPVPAETQREAIAFLAGATERLDENAREAARAKCIIVSNADAWHQLIQGRRSLILVPVFDDVDDAKLAADAGHHVYLPLDYTSSKEVLPRATRDQVALALANMGLPDAKSRALARECGAAIGPLRRVLAAAGEPRPQWAKGAAAAALSPLLIVGSWRENSAFDQGVVARISRMPYADAERLMDEWANAADPPVRHAGERWLWRAAEDAWLQLGRFTTRESLDGLVREAQDVLSESHPRFDLPDDDRWLAAVRGKTLRYSEELRKALAESLAWVAVRGVVSGIPGSLRPTERGAEVVHSLLGRQDDWRIWASLNDLLPTLAEAAPETFLQAVERAVDEAPAMLRTLFTDEGTPGLHGHCLHSGLLWALEAMAWEPDYLSRVATILGRLDQVDPGGRWMNRPAESLRHIFLGWHPQTAAPLERRLKAIDALTRAAPVATWKLLRSLLPHFGGDQASETARPRWRDWGATSDGLATDEDQEKCVFEVSLRLIRLVGTDAERWADLLNDLHEVSEDFRTRILGQLQALPAAGLPEDARVRVWTSLRQVLHRHREHSDAEWALPTETLAALDEVYELLTPGDIRLRCRFLFDPNPELAEVFDDDFQAQQAAVEAAQAEAASKLIEELRVEELFDFACAVGLPDRLGFVLGQSPRSPSIEGGFLTAALRGGRVGYILAAGFVAGRFGADGWSWADRLPQSAEAHGWLPDDLGRLACGLPFEGATWDHVEGWGEGVASAYWAQVYGRFLREPARDADRAVRSLLAAGRPVMALSLSASFLSKRSRPMPVQAELLAEILERLADHDAGSEPEAAGPMPAYSMQLIFEVLAETPAFERSRLALLEWRFLPLLRHGRYRPAALHAELNGSPDFFVTLVSFVYKRDDDREEEHQVPEPTRTVRASLALQLLHAWRGIPGISEDRATIDEAALVAWVRDARAAASAVARSTVADSAIGQMLSHAPVGADGAWPHEAVRQVIEESSSAALERGMSIGRHNQRGAVAKRIGEGGDRERRLADEYRAHKQQLVDSWPRTAAMLERISMGYDGYAAREDDRADDDDL